VTGGNGSVADRDQILYELRQAERFVLVTHENPDGDALARSWRCTASSPRWARRA
jgi:nanoRNase/pAp phosphatase (c-di-AMP/oligoRNAs hydrolase)